MRRLPLSLQREHDLEALDYVRRHPGCTVRDVARDVYRGNGDTRTPQRSRAANALARLERSSELRREYAPADRKQEPDRWFVRRELLEPLADESDEGPMCFGDALCQNDACPKHGGEP